MDARHHPILEAALEYAALGYRVIPLKPGTKVPDLRHWPEEASNDPNVVAGQFAASHTRARVQNPGTSYPNVGLVTGNGLAVLDIDSDHGGERPAWAVDTLTVRTASGGLHLYYAVDRPVPNSVGRLARGVDVRGERGQVAAPPSIIRYDHYRIYEAWLDIPEAEREQNYITDFGTNPRGGPWHVYAHGTYKLEVDRPIVKLEANLLIPPDMQQDYLGRTARKFEYRDAVPVGERNNYLTSLAGYLFATGYEANEVREAIGLESFSLGFSPRQGELDSIVNSVARYHEGPAI